MDREHVEPDREEGEELDPLPPVTERRNSKLGITALICSLVAVLAMGFASYKIGWSEKAWREVSQDREAFFVMLALLAPALVLGLAGLGTGSAAMLKPRIRRSAPVLAILLSLTVLIAGIGAVIFASLTDYFAH